MTRTVHFRPAARQDVLDAHNWYDERHPGLGARFAAALDKTLEAVAAMPGAFPTVHRDVRRALVRSFPYGIYFRLNFDDVHVIAVMHGRRDPSIWRARIGPQ